MWVINPAVGCHYFPPGLQLPPQPLNGLLPILLVGEQRHNGCEQFPKTVTRQRRDCDLNPCSSEPESSTLTTRLPSHPRPMVTRKLEWKTGLPDSESAIRFAIGSTVLAFWEFQGWHFAHPERNGPFGMVNVVNGSVGTVTSRHHTGHRGGPAIVTS